MTVKEIYKQIDTIYPFALQDDWDKSGLISFNENQEVKKILISLDINLEILNKAINEGFDLIVSHHPIYINENDLKTRCVKNILSLMKQHEISLIAIHTNFDKHRYGMNYWLLKNLGCQNIKRSSKSEYLFFGELKKTFANKNEFSFFLKNKLKVEYVKYMDNENETSKKTWKIALTGGAGSSESFNILKKDKCDYFITSEIKWNIWNHFNFNDDRLTLIEVPHSVEKIFIDIMKTKLKEYGEIFTIYPKTLFNV